MNVCLTSVAAAAELKSADMPATVSGYGRSYRLILFVKYKQQTLKGKQNGKHSIGYYFHKKFHHLKNKFVLTQANEW